MQFSEVIGQRSLINKLTQIIDSGRVSHAQLFLGKQGFGSLALAIAYAQYLNCKDRQHYTISDEQTELRADSCGKCTSCVKYRQLQHPDLHFVFPSANTDKVKSNNSSNDFQADFREFLEKQGPYATLPEWFNFLDIANKQGAINVRDAENIIQTLNYKSYESEYKVMIIWMVEKLRYDAAPKLLKTLEEPADNTLFLLVSESIDKVLSTIISRVQLVKVPPIDTGELEAFLRDNKGISASDAGRLAVVARGDCNEALHQFHQSETESRFASMFVMWMRSCFKIQMLDLNTWVEEISRFGRETQKQFLQYCLQNFHHCILFNMQVMNHSNVLNFGDEKFNTFFPQRILTKNIAEIEKKINESIYAIERNANAKILFMDLSFSLSRLLK